MTETPLYDQLVDETGPPWPAGLDFPPPPDIVGPALEAAERAAWPVIRERKRDENGRFLPDDDKAGDE